MKKEYMLLLQTVEQKFGHSLTSSPDFEKLSAQVLETTGERLSPSTMMRLWGLRPGVNPHKSTLNILARYIGYKDFADFHTQTALGGKKARQAAATTGSHRPDRRTWWAVAAVAAALLAAVAIYGHSSPRRITQPQELRNTKQYRIASQRGACGELGVIDRQLATTYQLAQHRRCLEQSNFAILQYEGDYYLYSVADKNFISFTGHEVYAPLAIDGMKLKLTPRDSSLVFSFAWRNTDFTLNINHANGIIITDYGLHTDNFDEGNLLEVYEAGDFDPTEPLNRLRQMKAEAANTRAHLVGNRPYAIYYSGGKGNVRHWLKADGTLTTAFSDSCRFALHPIEGDTLYSSPSFRVCHHAGDINDPSGCLRGFTMPKYANGRNTIHKGLLFTQPYAQNDFHGQAFFLGSNGCYAIRCTNAMTEYYGAGMYWGVSEAGSDGSPAFDYSPTRQYIWHVEPLH